MSIDVPYALFEMLAWPLDRHFTTTQLKFITRYNRYQTKRNRNPHLFFGL